MVLRYSDSSRRRTRSQSESTMKGFGPACSVPAGAWELGARPRAMRTAAPVSITAMPIRSPREGARGLLRGGPRFLRAKVFRSVTEVSAAACRRDSRCGGSGVSRKGAAASGLDLVPLDDFPRRVGGRAGIRGLGYEAELDRLLRRGDNENVWAVVDTKALNRILNQGPPRRVPGIGRPGHRGLQHELDVCCSAGEICDVPSFLCEG